MAQFVWDKQNKRTVPKDEWRKGETHHPSYMMAEDEKRRPGRPPRAKEEE